VRGLRNHETISEEFLGKLLAVERNRLFDAGKTTVELEGEKLYQSPQMLTVDVAKELLKAFVEAKDAKK
jgi:hypothetical protein